MFFTVFLIIFGISWAMAIGGIIATIFLLDKLKSLIVISYVLMGSLSIIAIKPMIEMLPQGMIAWLLIGGGCYILGIIFYLWKKLPYHHPIWHLCFSWKYFSFFGYIILSYLRTSYLNLSSLISKEMNQKMLTKFQIFYQCAR